MLRRRLMTIPGEKYSRIYVKTPGSTVGWDAQSTYPVVTDLQDAIDMVDSGGEVWISQGTYTPQSYSQRYSTPSTYQEYGYSILDKDLSIIGGFTGTEINIEPTLSSNTIIDGDYLNTGIPTDFQYCAFYVTAGTYTLTVKNLTVKNFRTSTGAGIFYAADSNQQTNFYNCIFKNLYSTGYGTVIYAFNTLGNGTNKKFSDCLFEDNSGLGGTIIFNRYSYARFYRCIIRNNTGTYGAVLLGSGSSGRNWFYNCLLYDNTASLYGGIGYGGYSNASYFYNCTLVNNTDPSNRAFYGDVGADNRITYILYNSIAYNGGSLLAAVCQVDAYNSNIEATSMTRTDGGGNIDTNPLFTNPATDDYTLQVTSPCIDTGDNNYNTESEDLLGNPRVVDGDGDTTDTVDMGCYEYQP